MLTIRLAREGRHKRPFFRVVLTEHTRPPQSGYKEVLWWYDPLKHKSELNIEQISQRVDKGAQLSSRVAKMVFNQTNDEKYKKFIKHRTVQRKTKKQEEE